MKSFKLTSKSLPKLSDEYGDCDQEGGGGGGGMPRSWEWPSLPVILLERDAVSEAMWTPVSLSRGEEEPVEDVNPSSAWNAGDRRALRTAMIFIFSCSEADCSAPVTNGHCRFLFLAVIYNMMLLATSLRDLGSHLGSPFQTSPLLQGGSADKSLKV